MINRIKLLALFFICILNFSSCYSISQNKTSNNDNVTNIQANTKQEVLTATSINKKYVITHYKPNISKQILWPDIYENKVVYANANSNTNEIRKIRILDIDSLKESIIYTPENDKKLVEDTRIGSEWVFWTESEFGADIYSWEIKAYNIADNKVYTLKKVQDSSSTLVPRIDNDDNNLVWLESYETENINVLRHSIYYFDFKFMAPIELAKINYVNNPYNIIHIRNNNVCYSDKKDDEWFINVINIETKSKLTITATKSNESNVGMACSDGNLIVWTEYKGNPNPDNIVYVYNIAQKAKDVADIGIDFFDITAGKIIYSKAGGFILL